MADIDTKSTVPEKRVNPFDESVEVSLRDQIPKKLLNKLRSLEIGRKVDELWNRGNADRTLWLERQQEFLSTWDEFLLPSGEGPFTLSSNLHIPMPFIVCKTYHARMLQAILANDPVAEPRRPDGTERAKAVSDMMRYSTTCWVNRGKGMEPTLDIWVWNWVTTGVGIKKWRWDTLYSKFTDVETVVEPGAPVFQVDEQGNERMIPTMVEREREVERVKKRYDQPACDYVMPEDLVLVGGDGCPQDADHVLHQQWLTKSELYTLGYQKIFDIEAVDEIVSGAPDHEHADSSTNIKEQRKINAGMTGTGVDTDLDRYRIIEAYLRVSVDNSGIDSDVVVWVHPTSGKLLRATYLDRMNKKGKRPFIKIDFHKRPGQQYGIGLLETLYPLSKEMDMMHNTRVDFGMLSTMPFAFYRAGSSIEPETIKFEPGQLIPVDNPQTDIYFPNLGNRTSFGFQEEAAIQTMVERLTGISDLSLGAMSGAQGPTRTATGARALIGEANANLDVHLRRLFRGYKESLEYLLSMLQERLPADFAYRVTGEDGSEYFNYIKSRSEIEGDYDFELDPSSAASNPEVRQQRAQAILNLAMNPLLLQTGLVTPSNLYETLKEYLLSIGKKSFARVITKPADFAIVLTPEDMANRILRGINVPVLPTDDNQGFLAYYQEIMGDDQLLGQFDQQQVVALTQQARARQALLQAMQQQQAQMANIAQQQANTQQATNPGGPTGTPQ